MPIFPLGPHESLHKSPLHDACIGSGARRERWRTLLPTISEAVATLMPPLWAESWELCFPPDLGKNFLLHFLQIHPDHRATVESAQGATRRPHLLGLRSCVPWQTYDDKSCPPPCVGGRATYPLELCSQHVARTVLARPPTPRGPPLSGSPAACAAGGLGGGSANLGTREAQLCHRGPLASTPGTCCTLPRCGSARRHTHTALWQLSCWAGLEASTAPLLNHLAGDVCRFGSQLH